MNFKDRGNKKWNSLMLVEHQRRLKELKLKEQDLEKPELDQQQLEDFNLKIKKAVNKNLNLKLIFYENKKIKEIKGTIFEIDDYKEEIKIKKNNNQIKKFSFEQIIEISI
ncbi:MAG: YolD-like family protein [Bacillota bacterium]